MPCAVVMTRAFCALSLFVLTQAFLFAQEGRSFEASLYLSKSGYYYSDNGVSIGTNLTWIPDLETRLSFPKWSIGASFQRYGAFYKIDYDRGDVESRFFSVIKVSLLKPLISRRGASKFLVGISPAIYLRNELISDGIILHASGWYEFRSHREVTTDWGFTIDTEWALRLSRKWSLKLDGVYYWNAQGNPAASLGLGIGYRFFGKAN